MQSNKSQALQIRSVKGPLTLKRSKNLHTRPKRTASSLKTLFGFGREPKEYDPALDALAPSDDTSDQSSASGKIPRRNVQGSGAKKQTRQMELEDEYEWDMDLQVPSQT